MTNQDQDLHCIGEGLLLVVLSFGISRFIFASRYCHSLEEALKRAKKAGKRPGCFYGGIVLKNGHKDQKTKAKSLRLPTCRPEDLNPSPPPLCGCPGGGNWTFVSQLCDYVTSG